MTARTAETEETLAFLRRAGGRTGTGGPVEVIETHFAWVFVGPRTVRKLRKPIRTAHFDLTTLERREAAAREEVRLNRTLAPDVYEGVARITRTADGALALGGDGATVDWLVVMRRLPAARALDLCRPRDARALEPLAALLADYYAHAPRVAGTPAGWGERVAGMLTELAGRAERRGVAEGVTLARALADWAGRRAPLLAERAAAGRIVDGHGDLRPEHVYLDRLDFDAELRRVDWAEDLALLAVDLERLRRPWIATALTGALARRLDDAPPPELLRFYRAWRGVLRAQLCLEHRARPGRLGVHGWLRRAEAYLAIARRHAARLS